MNHIFTESAERTLVEATHWAEDAQDPQFFLPGVFYGLLRETESRAAELLRGAGVTADTVRERWPKLVRSDLRAAGWPELSRTPRVFDEKIVVVRGMGGTLRRALRSMQRLLWDFPRPIVVATEHLLLTLATLEGECGRFLRDAGLAEGTIETQLRKWYGMEHRPLEVTDDAPLPLSDEPAELIEFNESSCDEESVRTGINPRDHNTCLNADDENPLCSDNYRSITMISPEKMAVWRILDAAGNRAGEALRVLEDHARFALDHSRFTERFKRIRHELGQLLDRFPLAARLTARNTPGDVGTRITTATEAVRSGLAAVVLANFCRLRESLRSLEEYSKIVDPATSSQFERLRYDVCTLERMMWTLGGDLGSRRARLTDARLHLIVSGGSSSKEFSRRMLAMVKGCYGSERNLGTGGVDVIQLRDKSLDDRKLLRRARILREITARYDILFIVNDRIDLAMLADADGVHLGQRDLSVEDARRLMGDKRLIGVSTHRIGQAEAAVQGGADYLGAGPVFPSVTKKFDAFPGLDYLREVAEQVTLPIFAIGGISTSNLSDVLATGVRRIAVASAVTATPDPSAAIRELRTKMAENKTGK